jgi:hypothetical protein
VLQLLLELRICFNLLAAMIGYEFCNFVSKSFIAFSVSIMRLVKYVVRNSQQYTRTGQKCNP